MFHVHMWERHEGGVSTDNDDDSRQQYDTIHDCIGSYIKWTNEFLVDLSWFEILATKFRVIETHLEKKK